MQARALLRLLAPTVALFSASLLLRREPYAVDIVVRQLISWVEPLRLLELAQGGFSVAQFYQCHTEVQMRQGIVRLVFDNDLEFVAGFGCLAAEAQLFSEGIMCFPIPRPQFDGLTKVLNGLLVSVHFRKDFASVIIDPIVLWR